MGGCHGAAGKTAVAGKTRTIHTVCRCGAGTLVAIVVLKTGMTNPEREDGIMAHHALLDDRPRSAHGLALTVLMLFATLIAIGAIAFATVHSTRGSGGLGGAAVNGTQLAASIGH